MKKLERIDEIAMVYLLRNEPHCIGVLDDEPKMAAAMAMVQLVKKGRAIGVMTDDGPSYRLTPLGKREAMALDTPDDAA
jgi:hypothetical protein